MWEALVMAELTLALILCWRAGLPTELVTYLIWFAIIACSQVSRGILARWADHADWETIWHGGLVMLATIPAAAALLVWCLRCWMEPGLAASRQPAA